MTNFSIQRVLWGVIIGSFMILCGISLYTMPSFVEEFIKEPSSYYTDNNKCCVDIFPENRLFINLY